MTRSGSLQRAGSFRGSATMTGSHTHFIARARAVLDELGRTVSYEIAGLNDSEINEADKP